MKKKNRSPRGKARLSGQGKDRKIISFLLLFLFLYCFVTEVRQEIVRCRLQLGETPRPPGCPTASWGKRMSYPTSTTGRHGRKPLYRPSWKVFSIYDSACATDLAGTRRSGRSPHPPPPDVRCSVCDILSTLPWSEHLQHTVRRFEFCNRKVQKPGLRSTAAPWDKQALSARPPRGQPSDPSSVRIFGSSLVRHTA